MKATESKIRSAVVAHKKVDELDGEVFHAISMYKSNTGFEQVFPVQPHGHKSRLTRISLMQRTMLMHLVRLIVNQGEVQ